MVYRRANERKIQHPDDCFLCTAFILLAMDMVSYGQESGKPDRLRVGFFEHEGYHEMDAQGNRKGYGYEVLQLLARYEYVTYEYAGYEKPGVKCWKCWSPESWISLPRPKRRRTVWRGLIFRA